MVNTTTNNAAAVLRIGARVRARSRQATVVSGTFCRALVAPGELGTVAAMREGYATVAFDRGTTLELGWDDVDVLA